MPVSAPPRHHPATIRRTRAGHVEAAGRTREVVEVLVGTVLLAAGIGIGGRHLQVAGWSPVAVAGLLVLLAGVAVLGAGVRRWWRRTRGARRLWALPTALLLAWFVAWPVTMALMVAAVPPIAAGAATPADRGIAAEEVTLVTADDVKLAAWYVPSRNGAAVVLRHGATSTRSSVIDQLEVLAHAGYGVLATDARGHGDSGGAAMALGWYGDLDVAAAVDHLLARPDVTGGRVGLVGLSMGGEEALGAAAGDARVRAVVAEGASGRTAADGELVLPETPARWFNVAQDQLSYALIDLLVGAPRPAPLREAVAAVAPRPVLLVTGGSAPARERTAAERLRAAAPGSVRVWEVEGSGHTGGLAAAPDAWRRQVVGFLDAALER